MTALELRDDEIGVYDPAAVRARKTRMWSQPARPGDVLFPQRQSGKSALIVPFSEPREPMRAAFPRIYPVPVGPSRPDMEPHGEKVQIRAVLRIVAHVYGISVNDILSQRRMAELVRPRQEAMWLARKHTIASLPQIGRQVGGRDHTTVLHAVRKLDRLIAEGSYRPHADAWVAEWRAYLGERDAMAPKPLELPRIEHVRTVRGRDLPPVPTRRPLGNAPSLSAGFAWSDAERERVKALLAAGWSVNEIGAHLDRSETAVRKEIAKAGIKLAPIAAE